MDLQVCAIIAIVFCVSLISLFFINQKLRGGKSFEDVLAEKRQLAHLVGASKYAAKKASARKAGAGDNNNKAAKKESRRERKLKEQRREQQPEAEEEETPNDSDGGSESHSASSNSPAHHGKADAHVEFDAELIVEESAVAVAGGQQQSKKSKKQQARKNSANAKAILVNKSDYVPIVADPAAPVETANHFEQIHPKDDVEIKRHRDGKASGKAKKGAGGSPRTEKPTIIAAVATSTTATEVEPIAVSNDVTGAAAVELTVTPRDSPKHAAGVKAEKVTKKKRNEHANNLLQHQHQQQLLLLGAHTNAQTHDDINVNTVMHLLGRADLSRSEIQIIIDYLLNKQQDTRVDHSDWSDDPLQKIKKQLLEREQALADEQEAAAGLQTKLREMRATINTLSAENRARVADVERLTAERQTEVQLLLAETKTVRERLESDNQRLAAACTRLQEELHKQQQQQAAGAEAAGQLQQLADANAQLQSDVVALQQSLQQVQADAAQSAADYESKVHEVQVLAHQREADVTAMFAQHNAYVDQLKQEVDEQAARAKRLDDSGKVEIRNLQNALDSSNREAGVCMLEANKWRQLHDELKGVAELDQARQAQQTQELMATVREVRAQLAERDATLGQTRVAAAQQGAQIAELQQQIGQRASESASVEQVLSASAIEVKQRLGQETEKVNELTARLAEQTATLQDYQDEKREHENRLADLQAQVSQYQDKNNLQQITAEQQLTSTRQLLERLFPAAASVAPTANHTDWLGHLGQHIEQSLQQQQQQLKQYAAATAAAEDAAAAARDAANAANALNALSAATAADLAKNSSSTLSNNNNIGGKSATKSVPHGNHVNHTSQANNIGNHTTTTTNDAATTTTTLQLSKSEADALIMENATLQATVEQYKTIVTETEVILNQLEAKVRDQDIRLAATVGQ